VNKSDLQQQLESRLGYQFKDPALLRRALTHRSFGIPNNERLEFLGDSILGAIIGHYLFNTFPQASEGQLTRLRASLVKGDTLAKVARELDLGHTLIMGEGELKTGGSDRDSILADAVESLIGSIYLEADIDVCTRVVLSWFESRLSRLKPDKPLKDAKTELQEWLQSKGMPLPEYVIEKMAGQAHNQEITVSCSVQGMSQPFIATARNKKLAEKQAAAQALGALIGES